jgi:HK97 family phage major capsid protein
MSYAKALRERAGRLGDQIQAIINKAKKEGNRGLTSEERERFHRAEEEYSGLEDSIRAEERGNAIFAQLSQSLNGGISELNLEEIQDTLRLTPAQKRERTKDPHARAFSNYIRNGGLDGLEPDERAIMLGRCPDPAGTAKLSSFRNVMSTTTGSQGGFVVPQGFSDKLETAKKWFGGIEGLVGRFTTGTGNPWPWPTINDTTNKGRILGQNVQVSETDLVFGQTTFNAYIGTSDLVLVPLALMEDAFFDMDALVAGLLGTRLGRLYNNKCTVGSGTNEPTGIVTGAVTAGSIFTLGAGNTASIAYSNLVDLEHSVDPAYRENETSRWMFSDTMLKLLKKMVDGSGRPLWQPGLTASFQQGAAVMTGSKPKILEHEYVVNNDFAVPAASAYSMLFGDLETFKVRELVSGTTVLALRERYADYLQTGFIAFQRFDSNLIDAGTHPIAVLQQSAT